MDDRREHEELRRSAPTLMGLPKSDPFVAPEGFFDRFPHEVQALVTARAKRPLSTWWKRAAIALPLLALVVWGVEQIVRTDVPIVATVPAHVPALSDEELDALDPHELFAGLEESELAPWDSIGLDLSDAELIAYAEQEGLDPIELITP